MEYWVVIMDETNHFVGVMDGMVHSVEVLDRMDHDIPGVLLQANLLPPMSVPYHGVGMDARRQLVRYNIC